MLRSKTVRSKIVGNALAIAMVVLTACTEPPPADATGEEIFNQVCANCHGEDLDGGIGPAIGAGSNASEQADDFLVLTITRGRGSMPSFDATLTDDQIEKVIRYLRSKHEVNNS